MRDLAEALRRLGLGQHVKAFAAADIDAETIGLLTEDDLKELGLSLGHRRRLLAALKNGRLFAASAEAGVARVLGTQPERRQITVLFCDIVGSTELTEQFDPEEMGRLIRLFQDAAAGAISRFDGFVDRFIGDGVLAFFGYPKAHENAAELAVSAGFAIIEAMHDVRTATGERLAARAAVASGLVFIGQNVSHDGAREQIATGEALNLAARLQQLAPANAILISHETRALLRGLFDLADLGRRELKGIGRPVRVWQVLGEHIGSTRFSAAEQQGLSPLVGRDAEFELLKNRWEAARTGEGQVVLLTGEAGMGKSRLSQMLRQQLTTEANFVLQYQCSPFHTNTALHPIIAQLQFAAGIQPSEAAELKLGKLERLLSLSSPDPRAALPMLAALLRIAPGPYQAPTSLSAEEQKQWTLTTLVNQLLGLARQHPVLMLVEDAHWMDPTTQEFVGQVISSIQDAPVLLVVTYRPDFQKRWTNFAHVTTLALSRLPKCATRELIASVAGNRALPPEVVDQIVAKTDGIPLFVEELTKAVLELDILEKHDSHYALRGPLPSLAIPATLQDSLLSRIDRLSEVKEVAQIGAVLGREFSYAHLAAMADLRQEALQAAIARLIQAELIHCRGSPEKATYVFKHALVQDTAYSTLLLAKRQQLHARCCEILLRLSPEMQEEQPEVLAHHYCEAGNAEQAAELWLKAGRRAVERSANVEALGHLANAMRVLPGIEDPARRNALEMLIQLERGMPLIATRGYGAHETVEAWDRARTLAEERGDLSQLPRALYGLWAALISLGKVRGCLPNAERVLQVAKQTNDDGLALVGWRIRGLTRFMLGQPGAAREDLERTLSNYDPDRHAPLAFRFGQNPRVAAMAVRATVLWVQGEADEARSTSLAAVAEAEGLRHLNSRSYSLAYGACLVARMQGDIEETERLADMLLALARQHRLNLWHAYGLSYKGWALAERGAVADGIHLLRRASIGFQEAGAGIYEPMHMGSLAAAEARGGSPEEATTHIAEAIAEAERREEIWCLPELLRLQADIWLRAGRTGQDAELLLREAASLARSRGMVASAERAEHDLASLRLDKKELA
ncbi:MAG: AAA family ATPase [Acetobacteraceae bacterium]|nr:AAA family ATPase [Acetobacteraceae bacterium]